MASTYQLQVIPVAEWPELRDLYKRNWPQHISSYYTVKNYIEWAQKNTKMNDVRISTIDDDWRTHGTYILEDRNRLRYNVLFNTLQPERQELILNALRCLEVEPGYTFTAYTEQVRDVAHQYLCELGITDLESGMCATLLYYLPKEESIKLTPKPLPGFVVKPLTEDYVTQIDNVWPHQYPGSDYFIQRVIRYNITFGVFDESTGELCAWAMQSELGTIGLLQVEEAYRRRGFAEHLIRTLSVAMAEQGMDVTAHIMNANIPSRRLFEKLGFKVIDKAYWFDKLPLNDERDKTNGDSRMTNHSL